MIRRFLGWGFLSVFALAAPCVMAQPTMLKFVFKGTCYQKDGSGNIIGVPITEQDLLRDRAQAGGVDPKTLAIVYHLGGDPKGDTVDVVNAADGTVQVLEFGFWFGSDASLGRSALSNNDGTEIRRVDQLFTLSDSTYTSGNSHGMGTASIRKRLGTSPNIAGTMQWIVNLASGTKICEGTFTASSPFVAGAGGNTTPPGGNGDPGPAPTSAAGSYNGLFYPDAGLTVGNSGALSLKISSNSKFTGSVSVGGKRYALGGTLDSNGAASQSISRGSAPPLTVAFRVDPSAPARITGIVSEGSSTANLIAQRAADRTTSAPAQAGSYTLVLPGGDAAAGQPAGDSWMTMTVDRNGRVRLAGTMADGTKVSQSGMLAVNGDMPVYVSLYGGKGALIGWLSLSGTDVSGNLIWTKPAATSGRYPAGFTLPTTAIGSI